jgi:Zn-dependent protease with chaperone function
MRLATAVFFLLCTVSLSLGSFAQGPPSSPAPTTVQNAPPPSGTPTVTYTLPPYKFQKAKALYDLRGTLLIIGTIWSFVVLLGILYFGIVAKYRDWAERVSKYSFPQAMIVVPLLLLTTSLLDLPLDAYEHSVSLRYGLSVQSWGSWFSDVAKGFVVAAIFLTFVLWLAIFIIRRSPRRWWFYFWLILQPIQVLLFIVTPLIIDPLFNKFEPLEKNNPQLVEAIEKVTQRGGLSIPRERMFLMKASEKTTELNAYVTGFGPSKRVVVWDTTIQKASTPETLFVFGHEMGHYVLDHVIYGMILVAIFSLVALYLAYRVSGWMLRRFGGRWHIRELGDWAVLPMGFLILSVFGFFASPVFNSISRQMEHNADIYGLEVTHGINANPQEAGAHAFQTLGELSLVYPYPGRLRTFWYGSHPSIPDRVRFAHEYDPWSKGEPPKYVK